MKNRTFIARIAAVFLFCPASILLVNGQGILDKQEILDRFTFWENQDWEWYSENIPFLETPDVEIDMTYYYRWEQTTIHLVYGSPADGYASTEFIDRPWWSGAFGTISCPAGHQLYDFRWFRNPVFLKDYARYWFKTPGAQPQNYTNWIADAIWQSYLVNRDFEFVRNLLNDLKYDYYEWERKFWVASEGMFAWDGMHDGMETNINSRQTPNWFAGAPGYRPTLNSYMWAHARSIVNIADLCDDEATVLEFSKKADLIKSNFLEKCWDPSRNFFFHRFQNDELTADKKDTISANTLTYQSGPYEGSPHGRELMGYIPWYFNLPDPGYESAWAYLMDPAYFYAEFGPTVVEQQDPMFHISERCCVWSGNSWPFASSQTLKAMANLLNNYEQAEVSRADYFELLKIFTMTHRKEGRPYIAEAVHPHTGSWDGHDNTGHSEHYYHSSYVDLIINDLIGVKPQASDSVEINPLVPEHWDYFCLDDLIYHGHQLSVVWDRDGKKYGLGCGMQVFMDGISIASSPVIQKIKVHIPFKKLPEPERLVNYAVNNSGKYYPKAIASFPGIEHPTAKLNDGQFWYLRPTTNQWSNHYSEAEVDWCGIDFGAARSIQLVKLYFIDDGENIKAPVSYSLEYWNGKAWEVIPGQQPGYEIPQGRKANAVRFPLISTSKIRCVLQADGAFNMGLSELEAWGEPVLPVLRLPRPESDNIALNPGTVATASYTSRFDDIRGIHDGSTSPAPRWTAFESPHESDWVQIAFDQEQTVHSAHVFFFKDGAGVGLPEAFKIQYNSGGRWKDVRLKRQIPETIMGNSLNIFKFREVRTDRIRLLFLHPPGGKFSGIYEVELYGH